MTCAQGEGGRHGRRPAPRSPSSSIRSSFCRCRRSISASGRSRRSATRRKADFDRAQELSAPRRLHQGACSIRRKTALDVADRNLSALRSDRSVIEQQAAEGSVLRAGTRPHSHRARLRRPRRHAGRDHRDARRRQLHPAPAIARTACALHARRRHASRSARAACTQDAGGARKEGRVRLVYPEIQGGRVIADVDVEGLGDYFVGERTRVYVTTGKRDAIVVPRGRGLSARRRRFRRARRRRRSRRADGRSARRRRSKSCPASMTATWWSRHERSRVSSRHFRHADAHLHQFAADAASAARLDARRRSSRCRRCRARRSRRSACRWSTSWCRPTATRRKTRSNSSPGRSRTSSRASTASSMSIRRRATTMWWSRRASSSARRRTTPCCACTTRYAPISASLPKGIPEPLIVGRGIDDVAIVVLTLSAKPERADRLDRQRPLSGRRGTAARTHQGRQRRLELHRRRQSQPDPRRARSRAPVAIWHDAQSAHRQADQRQPLLSGRRLSRGAIAPCRSSPARPCRACPTSAFCC